MKFFKTMFFIMILSICSFQIVFAQGLPNAKPGDVGLSSKRIEKIDKMIKTHIKNGELPGAVTLIARHGKIAHFRAFGQMDMENDLPMERNTIFRIASMTKAITSAAVMILYEEDHFDLNDPVSKYIPEMKNMKVVKYSKDGKPIVSPLQTVVPEREMTIRDLLRHTSGIIYGLGDSELDKLYQSEGLSVKAMVLADFIKKLTDLPLAFHPGEKWEYSYSTDVLGYLVEVISGKTLDKFFVDRIFKPLKMDDTGFYVPGLKVNRLSNVYRYNNKKLHLAEVASSSSFTQPPKGCSGGGGLVSTASDYARFLQMLLNYGKLDGKRILSRKTVELMTCDHLVKISNNWLADGVGFGLGFAILNDIGANGDLGSPGMYWWAGIFNTYFFVDPKEEMIGILMTQMQPFVHIDLLDRFRRLCIQSIDD